MTRRRTTLARAFTLLELLVATSIFSVLIGALYSLLHASLKLRETAHNAVEAGLPRAQVSQVIRRDLECAVMPTGLIANLFYGLPTPQGSSRQDTVEFYSTTGIVTDAAPWSDVQKVIYYVEGEDAGGESGLSLVRKTTRNLYAEITEDETEDDIAQSTILSGIESFTVMYWDADSATWLDDWDSSALENANPGAVSIRIDFPVKRDQADREFREPPIEIVCEIAAQPRPAPTIEQAGGGGGG